ncbi:MAG: hypothetical protein JWQ36_1182 [Enterovirga sp.]|jgi:hypothetical protein|nr:hypothetical protein [Enterovirga sp.]
MKMSEDVPKRRASADLGVVEPKPEAAPAIRPESAAAYIADMATELAGLARASRLDILAYLLDIAQLEAANVSRRLARQTLAR